MNVYRVKYVYGDDVYILADSMSEAATIYAKNHDEDPKDLELASRTVLVPDAIKAEIKKD